MAGREEENPWSREGIRRQLEELKQERRHTTVRRRVRKRLKRSGCE
jgi:hypothetical protein